MRSFLFLVIILAHCFFLHARVLTVTPRTMTITRAIIPILIIPLVVLTSKDANGKGLKSLSAVPSHL